ncbi:MAG: DNA-directed RNA polymerase subunit N [Candidatus Bathyarchaeota archaeon]|jgi:DNA-directed RNA polymerase subunit N|nr:DNA-directed RNA polymerase subunit N [Candidatus Bathyarchaeota archaeon]
MIIPIRCFTCGKVVADKWEEFSNRVKNGEAPKKVLDELGVSRYCCRRMFISHVDIIDDILKYSEATTKKSQEV